MSVNKIASRYAKTLLDLAVDQKKLDVVLSDVRGFQEASKNRDLFLLLKSPIVRTDKKLVILKEIFDGKLDPLTMSFVNIITKKGREMYLPEITDEFIALYNTYSSISKVTITTAEKLDDAELAKIKAKLAVSKETLDNLQIETKINPSIIGGFIIEIGDKLYDASVAHKLDELKKQFSSNDYEAAI